MIERYVVSRDDSIYEAFPDVALSPSGALVCVFLECTHHRDRSYTRVMLTRSTDQGRTWSPKQPLTEPLHGEPKRGVCWNCPRISTLGDGRLVVLADRIERIAEGRRGQQSVWRWVSADEGGLWDGPHATPATGIVPDQLIELQHSSHAGRWIVSAHVYEDKGAETVLKQQCWTSDNRGDTWSPPWVIAAQPNLQLCEGSIVELPGGPLVCFMRENSNRGMVAHKCISFDGGITWDGPWPAAMPGCHRPVAGMLASGRVLITHRCWQGGKSWRGWWAHNFFAALTDVDTCLATEHGENDIRIMPLDYDRSDTPDTGYSGWAQFEDGRIYVVNYIVDDAPNGQIRGYLLDESEFVSSMR